MFINKKAVKTLIRESSGQATKEFIVGLDLKVETIIKRAIKRANGHRLTSLTISEINGDKE